MGQIWRYYYDKIKRSVSSTFDYFSTSLIYERPHPMRRKSKKREASLFWREQLFVEAILLQNIILTDGLVYISIVNLLLTSLWFTWRKPYCVYGNSYEQRN